MSNAARLQASAYSSVAQVDSFAVPEPRLIIAIWGRRLPSTCVNVPLITMRLSAGSTASRYTLRSPERGVLTLKSNPVSAAPVSALSRARAVRAFPPPW